MLQEVYDASNDAHATLGETVQSKMKQIEDMVVDIHDHNRTAQRPWGTNYHAPHEVQSRYHFSQPHDMNGRHSSSHNEHPIRRSLPNIDTTSSLPGSIFRRSPTFQHHHTVHTIPRTVNLTANQGHYDADGLPPVNHDAALKRAKIQFTGLGDTFFFYSQLLNRMEQFGVYLLPLTQVQYKSDLCPESVNQVRISPRRHQIMASTLYQKLQSSEVIPLEYTAVRNIVNRFAA
jgi:hypothetical protein